jgi:hypothetical protein
MQQVERETRTVRVGLVVMDEDETPTVVRPRVASVRTRSVWARLWPAWVAWCERELFTLAPWWVWSLLSIGSGVALGFLTAAGTIALMWGH